MIVNNFQQFQRNRSKMINIIASKKEKKFQRFKNTSFFENFKTKSKSLKTRKFNALIIILSNPWKMNAAKSEEIEKKNLNSKKTTLIIFCLSVIFFVKIDFFFLLRIDFVKFSKNSHQKKYYLRSNKVNVKTFYYFSIKNETQNTTLFFESEKIELAFHFFVRTKRTKR